MKVVWYIFKSYYCIIIYIVMSGFLTSYPAMINHQTIYHINVFSSDVWFFFGWGMTKGPDEIGIHYWVQKNCYAYFLEWVSILSYLKWNYKRTRFLRERHARCLHLTKKQKNKKKETRCLEANNFYCIYILCYLKYRQALAYIIF